MAIQLILGTVLISLTLLVEVVFIGFASSVLTRIGDWLTSGRLMTKFTFTLLAVVLWMVAAISVGVWIWAGAFLILDQFEHLEEALYFSAVSITTLGYGDLVLDQEWRLLSGLIAANGLILFSLATAFFIEFIGRVRAAQEGSAEND